MDDEKELEISNKCDCHIHLRNIVDIGLKAVVQNITSIIAASLDNREFFLGYEVDFLFVLGNIHILKYNSVLYTIYTNILQEAINVSIEVKGGDTQGIVLQESIYQLLQPVIKEQSYMYDSFSTGNLHRVSSNTYGIYVKKLTLPGITEPYLSCIDCKDDSTNVTMTLDNTMIFLQKGQLIPNTGLVIKFKIGFKNMKRDAILHSCLLELGNS
jgi:hypothetical protein